LVPQVWLVAGLETVLLQNESATVLLEPSRQVTERVWVPPPHEAEQLPKLPDDQLNTHAAVLQACTEAGGGEGLQKDAATGVEDADRQVTVRVCVPPPQLAEHVLKVPALQV